MSKSKSKVAAEQAGIDDKFLWIDEHALEREWTNQPVLYHQFARLLADAKLTVQEADAEHDLTLAETEQAMRASPDEYGLEKVTESAIKSCLLLQAECQASLKALNKARHGVDVLEAAVRALDHRKKALEKLVELFLADYYSEPRVKGAGRERMDHAAKSSVRKAGQRPHQHEPSDDSDD